MHFKILKIDAGYPESLRQRQVDAIISQNALSFKKVLARQPVTKYAS